MTGDRPRGPVVLAPDKFKGSLSAPQVVEHLAAGLTRRAPDRPLRRMPVADGGEGTVDAAVAAGYRAVPVTVTGPAGDPVPARFALRDTTAIVEMAQASGLMHLPADALRPLDATSAGTGELIAAAVERGARRIVLGLGGSACTDGGAGMVAALGARLTDAAGRPLPPGGRALADLDRLDLDGMRLPAGTEILVAGDVDSPLLGDHGAARVFGPQKGAAADEVAVLERGLEQWARKVEALRGGRWRDLPGAGAAGGTGFAALALLDAGIEPGISLLLDLLGFNEQVADSALVITGEGALDEQTLRGKAPAGVARAARIHGVPVVAVCGGLFLPPAALGAAGFAAAYAVADLAPDLPTAIAEAGPLLERLAERIAAEHLDGAPSGAGPTP